MASTGKTVHVAGYNIQLEDSGKDTILMVVTDEVGDRLKLNFHREELKTLSKVLYTFAKRKVK